MNITEEDVIRGGVKNYAPTATILSMSMDDEGDSAVAVIEPPQTASNASLSIGMNATQNHKALLGLLQQHKENKKWFEFFLKRKTRMTLFFAGLSLLGPAIFYLSGVGDQHGIVPFCSVVLCLLTAMGSAFLLLVTFELEKADDASIVSFMKNLAIYLKNNPDMRESFSGLMNGLQGSVVNKTLLANINYVICQLNNEGANSMAPDSLADEKNTLFSRWNTGEMSKEHILPEKMCKKILVISEQEKP